MTDATKREPVWLKCRPCDHVWIVGYTPMEMGKFGRLLKGARCPMCAATARHLVMATAADIAGSRR